jgi:hypothetical protein
MANWMSFRILVGELGRGPSLQMVVSSSGDYNGSNSRGIGPKRYSGRRYSLLAAQEATSNGQYRLASGLHRKRQRFRTGWAQSRSVNVEAWMPRKLVHKVKTYRIRIVDWSRCKSTRHQCDFN